MAAQRARPGVAVEMGLAAGPEPKAAQAMGGGLSYVHVRQPLYVRHDANYPKEAAGTSLDLLDDEMDVQSLLNVKGKVALVTGGGAGLGKSIFHSMK